MMASKKLETENPTDFLQNNSHAIAQRNIEIHCSELLYFLRGSTWKKGNHGNNNMEKFWLNIESSTEMLGCFIYLFFLI